MSDGKKELNELSLIYEFINEYFADYLKSDRDAANKMEKIYKIITGKE